MNPPKENESHRWKSSWNFLMGARHVALASDNIVATVSELMHRGVEFLKVPSSYYYELEERVGKIEEDLEPLKNYLQIFSKLLRTGRRFS